MLLIIWMSKNFKIFKEALLEELGFVMQRRENPLNICCALLPFMVLVLELHVSLFSHDMCWYNASLRCIVVAIILRLFQFQDINNARINLWVIPYYWWMSSLNGTEVWHKSVLFLYYKGIFKIEVWLKAGGKDPSSKGGKWPTVN